MNDKDHGKAVNGNGLWYIFVNVFLGEEQAVVGGKPNATHCTQQEEGSLGPIEKRTSDPECSGWDHQKTKAVWKSLPKQSKCMWCDCRESHQVSRLFN